MLKTSVNDKLIEESIKHMSKEELLEVVKKSDKKYNTVFWIIFIGFLVVSILFLVGLYEIADESSDMITKSYAEKLSIEICRLEGYGEHVRTYDINNGYTIVKCEEGEHIFK